jgi:hypothetical protein
MKRKIERVVQVHRQEKYIHRRSMQDVWMMKVVEPRMSM